MRLKYDIADDVELALPADHEHQGWLIPGWHFFYLDALKLGIRFPIKGLAKIVLDHYDITPSQLCLSGWKILLALGMLGLKQGLQPLSIDHFLQSYYLHDHDLDKGWYNIYMQSKTFAPVINLPCRGDTVWKFSNFLVRGNLAIGANRWSLNGTLLVKS